uniref:Uncharacterized protein n=1 Tax=Cacopsylla melanoneura TaxID=428564 RepID=A0A8D8U9M4_9HEMI
MSKCLQIIKSLYIGHPYTRCCQIFCSMNPHLREFLCKNIANQSQSSQRHRGKQNKANWQHCLLQSQYFVSRHSGTHEVMRASLIRRLPYSHHSGKFWLISRNLSNIL